MALLVIIGAGALLATGLAARLAGAQQPPDAPVIARVTIPRADDLRRFIALGLDMLELREGSDYFILTTPSQIAQLAGAGWAIREDAQQSAMLHPGGPAAFLDGYRTVSETYAFLADEAARYPALTQVFTYGRSYAGRDLAGIRLTNRQITGTKPVFFLMAAIHARELSTAELATRLVDYLLSHYGSDGDATWLLDEHLIVVVPVANPDGRVIAEQGYYQRKNVDPVGGGGCADPATVFSQIGVDLNRNSDFKWGTVNPPTEDPCSQTYPGPGAVSEPETAAIESLIRSLFADQRGPNDGDAAPITTTGILITLHSYGDLVLYPWGWTSSPAPNSTPLAFMGSTFASYNGFVSEQSTYLYPTSGTTDDWSYGELGVPSFTFEVGQQYDTYPDHCGGFFPAFSCLDGGAGGSFWPRNLPAFLYAARIARAPYALARGPTRELITVTPGISGQVSLQALLDKQSNGGQNVTAAEYYVDTPPWRGGSAQPMAALDGAFDNPDEVAIANAAIPPGRHLIFVRGQDSDSNWGPVRAAWVSVLAPRQWLPFVAR